MRGREKKKEKNKKERKKKNKKEKKRQATARGHACQLLGGEVHLFIRFEQHPKITDLFVPKASSWWIMDGGGWCVCVCVFRGWREGGIRGL